MATNNTQNSNTAADSPRKEESDTVADQRASDDVDLRVENLTKTFGDEVAVDNLSIDIKKGDLKSLLGPSGCGKSTTLRCIAGLEHPDSGRIYIGGELVSAPEEGVHVEPENRGLGMVFQSYAVWPHMTVEENINYPLKVQGIGTKGERQQKVDRVLDAVGLAEYSDNLATNLSGGQQQRVAISRALVVEPDILLFDEPLSNLDAKLRREMRLEINRIYKEFNTTVLYVTHSQDEAMFLSDEISIMRDGSIIEEGPPASLHSDPQTFFGMNFMGRCNTVSGKVTSTDGTTLTVDTDIGTLSSNQAMANLSSGDQVFACFRPKFCRLLTEDDPISDEGTLTLKGTVKMQAATRDFTEYQVERNDMEILVRTPEPEPIYRGDEVDIALAAEDVKVFSHNEGVNVLEADHASTAQISDDSEGTEQSETAITRSGE